jgi:hypothetical protein
MRPVLRVLSIAAVLLGGACTNIEGAPEALVLEQVDVDVDARGVAVDGAGRLFVIDGLSLYERVDGDWTPRWQAPAGTAALEDVTALEPGRFALTAINMGYELDLATSVLSQHFCYLPGEGIREEEPPPNPNPTFELARAVTFDRASGLLYAQPQTRDLVTNDPTFSEIAMFDRASGDELRFVNLGEPDYSAGGIAMAGERILAAQGSILRVIEANGFGAGTLDLSTLGIASVEGMAVDADKGELFVLDGPNRRIVGLDFEGVTRLMR